MPSPALVKIGPEEDGVELEYSNCEFSVLSSKESLERGGRESVSCLGGDVVGKNLTCVRGKVVSNNRQVPGLSIQIETLWQDDSV